MGASDQKNPSAVKVGAVNEHLLMYLPGLVQVLVSGGWLVDGFVFDGGEFAQACLSASAVVLGFDPVADGGLELVSAVPVLLIKDVLLEQGEEGFHCRVIRA